MPPLPSNTAKLFDWRAMLCRPSAAAEDSSHGRCSIDHCAGMTVLFLVALGALIGLAVLIHFAFDQISTSNVAFTVRMLAALFV